MVNQHSPPFIEVGSDDEPNELRPPKRSREWDRHVAEDVFTAFQRQQEEIMALSQQALSEYAKGNFDSGNALAHPCRTIETRRTDH
jgi:hypothetical protein